MSQEDDYTFAEGIPLAPSAPGTTVLVAGPPFSQAQQFARSMVVSGTDSGEGALFISTTMTSNRLLEACKKVYPALDTDQIGVVDCTGQEVGQADSDIAVKYVSTQNDLTGIGMRFSALYESMYAAASEGRVRTALISLSSMSMYVELRTLFQFAHTLSARIDSAGGLGVFALDPDSHDAQTVNTLSQIADGRIEVRESEDDADGELRVAGLTNQPREWTPFHFGDRENGR